MKRVLITGITGYIGSNLARSLYEKYEVYGLVREPINTEYINDFRNQIRLFVYDGTYESVLRIMQEIQPDTVYHLASLYTGNHRADQILTMHQSNLLLGNFILEAMAACGVQNFVFASSVMCHYHGEMYNPLNLYAATKQAFSDIMKYYTEARNIHSLTLVLTDSYGPNDHRRKILNLLKDAAGNRTKIEMSEGSQIYDVLYIDDIVNAFEMAGLLLEKQTSASSIYQLYSTEAKTLRETVELMQTAAGVPIQIEWGKRPQSTREIKESVRVYESLPGWQPRVSLQEGLKRFWSDKTAFDKKNAKY